MTAVFVNLHPDIYDLHGIYALTAALRNRQVEVFYVDGRLHRIGAAIRALGALRPDVLLYSSFASGLPDYIAFDRDAKLRFPEAVSVIGGPGPTFNPGAMDGSTINAVCVGEGEASLVGFIKSGFAPYLNIQRVGQPRSCDRAPLAAPDDLPMPDRSAVYRVDATLREMPSKQFQSGRGCPYSCAYCHNHSFREMFPGPPVRKKSVSYLIEEIRGVRRQYGLACVVFNDDLFIADRKWLAEFCETFPRAVGLPFTCNVRANLVDDDVAAMLKAAGCRVVNWSIESGDPVIRETLLNRNMTDEQILGAASALNKHGIRHRIGNIIGLPNETREQMERTLKLNMRAKPSLAVANIFIPYLGLRLTETATKLGCFDARTPLPKSFYDESPLRFSDEDKKWIIRLMLTFGLFVKWPMLYGFRGALFKLPLSVLRFVRSVFYGFAMMRLYVVRTPLRQRLRLVRRLLA